MGVFERFTDRARQAVVLAQQEARGRGDDAIDTEHLLLALFAVPGSLASTVLEGFSVRRGDVSADLEDRRRPSSAAAALATLGIDLDEVRRRVEEAFGPGALDRGHSRRSRRWLGHMPFSKDAKKALQLALREALRLKHTSVDTEHLLLGVLHGQGTAHDVLVARGVQLDIARVIVDELVRGRRRLTAVTPVSAFRWCRFGGCRPLRHVGSASAPRPGRLQRRRRACHHRRRAHRRRHDLPGLPRAAT
jgi:ATP-dependent Clp protease ATP-binding subunit ClpA